MKILAFDTSASEVQVALVKDGEVTLAESLAPADRNRQEAASLLLPCIDKALQTAGWHKSDLDAIAVGVGPGSFTGVRVAVITARSIGQALQLAVLPVSTLEVLASLSRRPCGVVLDAGASKIYAAVYDCDLNSSSSQLLQPFCGSLAELAGKLAELSELNLQQWVMDGTIDPASIAGNNVPVSLRPQGANLAAEAGLLAAARFKLSDRARYPWHEVFPLYLRSPSVTLKKTQQAADTQEAPRH